MKKVALTGIKPTGIPHLGNYLGAIQPAMELAKDHDALYFIADYHALTTVRDRELLNNQIHKLIAELCFASMACSSTVKMFLVLRNRVFIPLLSAFFKRLDESSDAKSSENFRTQSHAARSTYLLPK